MITSCSEGFVQSQQFLSFKGLRHGYSARAHGDMRIVQNRLRFQAQIGLAKATLVMPAQTHGDIVSIVYNASKGEIASADGLVYKKDDIHPVSLGVIVADCVPLLFVDMRHEVTGVAHAGWKGTYAHIASHVVEKMVTCGAQKKDIFVGFGPYIGNCCYSVDENRAVVFESEFGKNGQMIIRRNDSIYLDLGVVNRHELEHAGISSNHIEDVHLCTSTLQNDYFSFRKDTKESFGEIIGLIGFST